MTGYCKQKKCGFQYKHYRFDASIMRCLVVVSAVAFLLQLSHWQWHRALEKKQLNQQYTSRWQTAPRPFDQLTDNISQHDYQTTQLTGTFINQPLLLDNQIFNHQVGYHILYPFQPAHQHKILLINLGWIPRHKQPLITLKSRLPKAHVSYQLTGHLYPIHRHPFALKKNQFDHQTPWQQVQYLSQPELQAHWQTPVYSRLLLLGTHPTLGLQTPWQFTHLSSARHIGYLVQFALLAACLVIIFIASHSRKVHSHVH